MTPLTLLVGAVLAAPTAPNEVGRIPVIMYHSIGDRGAYDRRGLNISVATFKKQLELMYAAGWYPINVRDLVDPETLGAVPAGKTPVALTFDDARGSQFHYRGDGAVDENCAVGILEAFHKRHSDDWPRKATFYVLPRSPYNPTPFWQAGQEKKKVDFLVDAGYEIGNHSTTHRSLARADRQMLVNEATGCTRAFKRLNSGATMDTFCLPYGSYPGNKALWRFLQDSGQPNSPYHNKLLLMAWGDETYAPLDKRFDPQRVSRLGVDPGYLEAAIRRLSKSPALYRSDGDPATVTVPEAYAKYVSQKRLGSAKLVVEKAPPPRKKAKKE